MQRHLEYFDDRTPGPVPEPTDSLADARHMDAGVAVPLAEREAMAWPPAAWERSASAWRQDVWSGPDGFVPFPATDTLPPLALPAGPTDNRTGLGTVVRELVETGVLTLLLFLGFRLVIQNFKIEGSSMEPTLHSGQYLLVNKLAYRGSGEPQRGDIIVFKSWTPGKDFIKRVVGMPGESVEMHDNAVWINGERLEESYLDQVTAGPTGPVHLSDQEYFVMGDNRGNSSDSRNHGALRGDWIIGKAWFTYWPPGEIGLVPASTESPASASD